MDLVCFSHLRWNFVYQRPQHLLSRFAKNGRLFFIEEPIPHEAEDGYTIHLNNDHVWVVVPHLKDIHTNTTQQLITIVNTVFADNAIENYICWYYTPMALAFTQQLNPALTVYDCMDELSAFKNAPPTLLALEDELFTKADVVFTGGHTLYQHKKNKHHNIYPFPSSIDKAHFKQARTPHEPADQQNIPPVRFGFYGVVDERFDIDLIAAVAAQKPLWQFVIIGPVVKIDPEHLPKNANIHYIGGRKYEELPAYLSGWDVAIIPFAINESTRFISPTKTPEYLAAGKPVISTPINDVVHPYGDEQLVHIVNEPESFIAAAEAILADKNRDVWLQKVDDFLANLSWDETYNRMKNIIEETLNNKQPSINKNERRNVYV